MAFDGNSLMVSDWICRPRDTAVGTNASRWKGLGGTFAGIFSGLGCVKMPFVCHSDEVKYVH